MQADFSTPTPVATGTTAEGTAWSRYGQGLPLVLIHGVGMSQEVWAPQINSLADHFDVTVYDMWGHGKSSLPDEPLMLAHYAKQLLGLVDALGIDRAHVVGHSMGALVALDFALKHQARCISVVAMNAVFSRTEAQRSMVKARSDELRRPNGRANVDDTMKRWFGDPIEPDCEQAEKLARKLLESVNPAGYALAYQVFATADAQHAPLLKFLEVPALFFTGELDPNSTPAMSHAMADLTPNAVVNVLTAHRHMMSLTAPLQVSSVLRTFFVESRRPSP